MIWKHRLERAEWIARDELHKRFTRSVMEHLGGSLVMDHRDGGRACYRLTLLGLLLTGIVLWFSLLSLQLRHGQENPYIGLATAVVGAVLGAGVSVSGGS